MGTSRLGEAFAQDEEATDGNLVAGHVANRQCNDPFRDRAFGGKWHHAAQIEHLLGHAQPFGKLGDLVLPRVTVGIDAAQIAQSHYVGGTNGGVLVATALGQKLRDVALGLDLQRRRTTALPDEQHQEHDGHHEQWSRRSSPRTCAIVVRRGLYVHRGPYVHRGHYFFSARAVSTAAM